MTKYLYRVRFNEMGLQVTAGIFDPTTGGIRFGYDANLTADEEPRTGANRVEVSQGAIGSHSPDDAELRIDVYQQVASMARFIKEMLDEGESYAAVGEFLKANLAVDPMYPAASGFKYGGK